MSDSLEHDNRDLASRTLNSLFWVVFASGTQSVFKLVLVLVLSRLLTPSEFGVIAAATVVIGLAEVFAQMGIGPALVQKPEVSSQHIRSAVVISVFLGVLASSVIVISAPLLSLYFSSSKLTPVLQALSVVFVLRSLTVVSESLLARSLQFRQVALIDTAAFILYCLTSVVLAYYHWGVWSIVMGTLMQSVIRTLLFLLLRLHRWSFYIDIEASKELFRLGSAFSVLLLLNYFALQGDYLVVGRTLDIESLGFYSRAYQLMGFSVAILGQALNKVVFASMANIQSDDERLKRSYLKQIGTLATLLLPFSVLCLVVAPEVIYVLLGAGWEEVVVPFQILSLGFFLTLGYRLCNSFVQSVGVLYQNAIRQALYGGAVILGAWIGHYWGIVGVSVGVLVALSLHYMSTSQQVLYRFDIRWSDYVNSHINGIRLSFIVFLLSFASASYCRNSHLPNIMTLTVTGLFTLIPMFILSLKFPGLVLGMEGQWLWRKLQQIVTEKVLLLSNKSFIV